MRALGEEHAEKAVAVAGALFSHGFSGGRFGKFHYRREGFIAGGSLGVIARLSARPQDAPDWLRLSLGAGAKHVLYAAYPRPEHAAEISKGVAGLSVNEFVASPGYDLPGSLGLLAAGHDGRRGRPPRLLVDFIQGSFVQSKTTRSTTPRLRGDRIVDVPYVHRRKFVREEVAVPYRGWKAALVSHLFSQAGPGGEFAGQTIALRRKYGGNGAELGGDNARHFTAAAARAGYRVRATRNWVVARPPRNV